MVLNCYELLTNENICLVYLFDRVLRFNYFNIINNKYNNIRILNNLFILFLNDLKIFFLFNAKFISLVNSFLNFIKGIIINKNNYNNIVLESSNLFCKFYYIKFYNKLVVKFSRYDIKVILFNSYGFNESIINNKEFLLINKKRDKLNIIEDYLNNFSGKIRNIRKCNVYTGKGIKYSNEVINIKVYRKIK